MHGYLTVFQTESGRPKADFYSQVTFPDSDSRGYLFLDPDELLVLAKSITLEGKPENRFDVKEVTVEHEGENVKISWEEGGDEAYCQFCTIALLTQIAPARIPTYLKNMKELDRKKSKKK